uniref:RING-CH-type domain-containing protein n=1 Tax=Leersia perrieri TaxID=77586 RepID=A0A0D9X3C4_9ORYZ
MASPSPSPPPTPAASGSGGGDDEEDEEEEQCRICRQPAEAGRPLRYPCACRGSIRFVHDDCLLRWLATRRTSHCEVCKRLISTCPLYAADAPARLPLWEFMVGVGNKLMGWLLLLLSLVLAMYIWEFVMPFTTLWIWRLALSRTFARVRHLLSIRSAHGLRFTFMPSPDTVLACVSIRRAFLRDIAHFRDLNVVARIAADALAPFAHFVARLEARLDRRFGGLDSLQVIALHIVEASFMVVLVDMMLAFAFGFIPFSLGRIILFCISCFSFGNIDGVYSHTSTLSILFVGYGFLFSLALLFTGLHTFDQYSRGERLTIAVFFKLLTNIICMLFIPFRRLPGIHVMLQMALSLLQLFFRGIINLAIAANMSVNLINIIAICPLFFGWSVDICASQLFGGTIYQKLELPFASSFASTALHWLIGCIYMMLLSIFSSPLCLVLGPGVTIPFVHFAGDQNLMQLFREPFYTFSLKMLPGLFISAVDIAMVILVPVQIATRLAPTLFPLDITYFEPPTKGSAFWQAPRNYAELLSGALLLRFVICNTLKYLQPRPLLQKVLLYWFAATGHVLGLPDLLIAQSAGDGEREVGNSSTQKCHHGSTSEAQYKRGFAAIRMILLVVLAWSTLAIFNSAVLIVPVSVGRALLFAIPKLPVAGGLKYNDLFAFAIGFCITSTMIVASRDLFVYMASGRTHLLAYVIYKSVITALKGSPLLFIWVVIIPVLIGLLLNFLLISPFTAPANDILAIDLFCTWFLGLLLLKFWVKLVHWTRVAPFLIYFIDERWDWKLTRARMDGFSRLRALWILQDILMPITMKLLTALCVPYALARGVFPNFGYPDAVNSAVYRFAWLGGLALCMLCHLAKVFCKILVKLHDSIRDERYLIGRRLQNYVDNSTLN